MSTEQKTVRIEVDNKATEELVKFLKEKEEKKPMSEGDLAEKKIQVYQKFNDSKCFDCQSKEELSNFVTGLINERAPKPTPSGSAPMNDAQFGIKSGDLYRRKFSSDKEMIDSVLDQMRNGKTQAERDEARSYYDKMLGLWVRSKRHNQGLDGFYDPNKIEHLPNLKRTPEGFMTPENKDEGDIGKILAHWRIEAKRKREEGVQ